MSYNPAEGFPRVVPELLYRDAAAAVDWLARVFDFQEVLRWNSPDGAVGHADMELEGGIVMLGNGEADYRNPADLGYACVRLVFFVGDVDRHFRRAKEQGAAIISEPQDKPWGLRQYVALDPEGHVWEFTQHVRDVEPHDWGARVP